MLLKEHCDDCDPSFDDCWNNGAKCRKVKRLKNSASEGIRLENSAPDRTAIIGGHAGPGVSRAAMREGQVNPDASQRLAS